MVRKPAPFARHARHGKIQRILYLRSSPDCQGEHFMSGVRFAAKKAGALFSVVTYGNAIYEDQRKRTAMGGMKAVSEAIRFFRPDAMIVEYSRVHRLPPELFAGCRVVMLDARNARNGFINVRCDNASIARAAFAELARFGWPHYAYVHWFTASDWDRERCRTFQMLAEASGADFLVHRPSRASLLDERFIRWIHDLPPETAVFAANDVIARNFVEAAEKAGRAIPLELAVVGADNNFQFCEGGQTSISSVERDLTGAGKAAVEALLDGSASGDILFGAQGVVRRDTTVRLKGESRIVLLAHEFIRRNLGAGIDIDDVARELKMGRRTLERRIRSCTGRSIGEMIREERFDLARSMLADGTKSIQFVANFCGYKSDSSLRTLFGQRLGISPDEFRRRGKVS